MTITYIIFNLFVGQQGHQYEGQQGNRLLHNQGKTQFIDRIQAIRPAYFLLYSFQ